ncbi:hypothetical protein BLNAU_19543 [Blattamonas nauphoetae]|uniref:Protein kinase domain-containing protein n=1 Tax=Blattamonas nauphoetae TaxID=2049346 RepID=A0ABQ9X2E1_9EUKA|nr:hypothetical protein BLNAU_19543 [Blattamonas nauphoetae]
MIALCISLSFILASQRDAIVSLYDYQPTLLPLSEALRHQQFSDTIDVRNEAIQFELAEGSFHTDGHHFVSQKAEIEGRNTMIVHSNQTPQFSSTSNEHANSSISNQKTHLSIFIVTNSSLTLKSLILSVWKGERVCFVDSSDVELVGCRIGSSVECSPLVVSSPKSSRSTTITMIGCSHDSSESWLVHPFVGLDRNRPTQHVSSTNNKQPDQMDEGAVSVIGSSLFFSTSLIGRSGPLLEMDTNTKNDLAHSACQQDQEICSTALISSSFMNVSSHSLGHVATARETVLTQKVIGCSLTRSTDHFSGTGIRDMNMGGSVLCSNSSFAHCSSAANEDITQGGQLKYSRDTETTHEFASCTFRHMKDTSASSSGGSAICFASTVASMKISQCAFHNCSTNGSNCQGGAVFYEPTDKLSSDTQTVAISQSSFSDCSSGTQGGALAASAHKSVSVDGCLFRGNSAGLGGAFIYEGTTSSLVSNSSFVSNRAMYGGAIYHVGSIALKAAYLLFRDNTATMRFGGTDIVIYAANSASLTTCDSSSNTPTIFFNAIETLDSTSLTRVSKSFAISSCSVSHSETTSTVTVTTMSAVTGVMSVLLSGGLVPRLVFVTFGSTASTTGTGTTTTAVLPSTNLYKLETAVLAGFKLDPSLFGAFASLITPNTARIELHGNDLVSGSYSMLVNDGSETSKNISLTLSGSTELSTTVSLYPTSSAQLKYGTKYTVKSVKRGTTSLAVNDGLSFTTPDEPARIVGIWGELDSNGNTTSITVRGRKIPTGSFTVRLNSESGHLFDISFSDAMSDERNSNVASISIFGDSPVLSFGTTYTLFSVVLTSSPSTHLLIDANPNTFMISEPSRITDVTIGDFSDAQKTEATLTMTGRALKPNTDYVMRVTGQPRSTSLMGANTEADKRTITIRSDSSDPSESGSKSVVFYPHTSADLLFGYEYIVDSVSLDGDTLLQNSDLFLSTPFEPSYLSSIESYSLTDSKDGLIVILKGFALKQSSTLMIVESSDEVKIESDGQIDVKTESECWISFQVGWEENTTHLEFLKQYTLTGGKGGSSELIITPNLHFTVPSGPIVTKISAPISCSSSSFSVGIVGTDLPIEAGFKVELDGHSFLVDFDSSTSGNGTISASLSGQMQFDTQYYVKSVMKDGRKMKCVDVSFRTPLGPTLVNVSTALNTSNINNVIVSLESLRMPVGEMTLTVQEGSSTPIALTVSFVSSEAGSVEVVVFGGSTLKYGTSYTVVSLTSSSLHCSLADLITFETPATPPRIKTASCSLVGDLLRDGEVVLTGEGFPAGTPFSISLDEIDDNGVVIPNTSPISLPDRFGGEIGGLALKTHTLSITLFPVPQKMKYSGRYRIICLSIPTVPTGVEKTATFGVPPEPARVSQIESYSLTDSKDGLIVILKGFALKQSSTLMIVESSDEVKIESDGQIDVKTESECWISFQVGWEENTTHLEFLKQYTLTGGKGGSSELIITPNLHFTVPSGPIVTKISAPISCSSSSFSVGIVGTDLPIEAGFKVELDGHSFLVDFDSSTSGNGTISASLSGQMQFDTQYYVKSVMKDGRKMKCVDVSFRTPLGPTLVNVSTALNTSNINNVIVSLESLRMPVGEMNLSIKESGSTPIEIEVSFVSSEAGSVEVVVFGGSTLKYGTLYTVVSLRSSSLHCSLDGSITFETPAAPPRIKTASCSLVGELQRSGDIVLTGEALPAGESFSMSLDEIDENGDVIAGTTPITLSDRFDGVIGDTALTTHTLSITLFPVAQLMKYSRRSRITSLTISTVPTVRTAVEETAIFQVPAEPARIVGIWVELDSSGNTTLVTVRGRQIAKGSYTVRLNSESGPWFDISFSDEMSDERNSNVASISIFGDSPVLSFGTTYTLFSVVLTSSPSTHLLIDANPNTFMISEPSRITDVTIGDFSDAQKTEATLTMTGRALKPNTDYVMRVTGHPKSTSLMGGNSEPEPDKRTITVRSDSTDPSESGSKTIKFYPLSSAELLFGYEYIVDSVTLDGSTLLQNSGLSFTTPDEPARIVGIWVELDSSGNTTSIVLRGRQIAKGSYTVRLNSESGHLFDISFSDEISDERNSNVASISIFGDSPVLSFGTTYTLFSVVLTSSPSTHLLIDANPNTFMISEPSRITDVTIGDFSDAQKTEATLTMTGRALKPNTDYAMHVTGQPRSTSLMGANTEADKRTITIRSDSSDPSESGSKSVVFYPHTSADLLFGYEYIVDSVSLDGSPILQNSGLSFSTPDEPARLISVSPQLAASLETVTLTFGGRCYFVESLSMKLKVTSPSTGTPFELKCSTLSATELTLTLPISTSDPLGVQFGDVLSVLSLKSDSSSVILDISTFSIPHPPCVDNASFSFYSDLNTTFSITLHGNDLPSNERFLVVLDSDHSFEVVFTNSHSGTSGEMAIGWADTLEYNTEYRIISIKNNKTGRVVFVDSLSFTTGKRPKKIVMFFDSSSSDSSRLCGSEDQPCSSMDSAWMIAENVRASDISLRVVLNATLSSPIVCLRSGIVVVEKGTSTEPTLTIPSSASMGETAMIEISSGLFEIRDVDVVIESIVPSFVLLSAIDSTIILRDGSIVGVKTRNDSNSDELRCEWGTGALRLSNCTTNVTDTVLSHLRQGAINVKGGALEVVSSTFFDNSPAVPAFPSTRQNIRCSEKGEIEIGSLNGGDGTVGFPSAWISATDCVVGGATLQQASSHFIPTLSSTSTSSFNKKDKTVTLEMIGTTLIPCSLMLEVYEKKSDGKEGLAKLFPLTQDSTGHFNDTTIVISLPLSSLSSFDTSLEWRGRLVFGEGDISTTSFLIQENSSGRIAQAMKENMKWWLPLVISLSIVLVIVVVVVFVCWRRRRAQKNGQKDTELNESDPPQMDDEKMDIVTDNRIGVNSIQTFPSSESNKATKMNEPTQSDVLIDFQNMEEALPCNGDWKKTVFLPKDRTLYNALHSEKKWDVRIRQAQLLLVQGLKRVVKKDREAVILRTLTAHNIFFDSKENVCFKLNLDITPLPISTHKPQPDDQKPEQAQQEHEPTVETNESKQTATQLALPVNEGVRWYAPEVISNKQHINSSQGAVFSLGLLLWEMETGCVPFGEHDAVNASRQIVTGVQPKLELVKNNEMRELISQCLNLEPHDRPDLDAVETTLTFLPPHQSIHLITLAQS